MTDSQSEPSYRHETLKVIRGREASTIKAKQSQGWELVTRTPGALRTELTFRQQIKPTFLKPWMAIAGLLAVGVLGLGGMAISEAIGGDDGPTSASGPTSGPSNAGSDSAPNGLGTPTPDESTAESSPDAPVGPLTVANNPDLKRMLSADDDYVLNKAFADMYVGQQIEFNGSVADATGGNTLVYAGPDSDVEYASGPAFQFRGADVQVEPGESARFVGTVVAFNVGQGLLFLDLVSATPR